MEMGPPHSHSTQLPRSLAHSDPHVSLCLLLPWPGPASAPHPLVMQRGPSSPAQERTPTRPCLQSCPASQPAALGAWNALRYKQALPLSRSNTSGLLIYTRPKIPPGPAPPALHAPTFQSYRVYSETGPCLHTLVQSARTRKLHIRHKTQIKHLACSLPSQGRHPGRAAATLHTHFTHAPLHTTWGPI